MIPESRVKDERLGWAGDEGAVTSQPSLAQDEGERDPEQRETRDRTAVDSVRADSSSVARANDKNRGRDTTPAAGPGCR